MSCGSASYFLDNSVKTLPAASLFPKATSENSLSYNRIIWDLDSDSIHPSPWLITKQIEYLLMKENYYGYLDMYAYVDSKNESVLDKLKGAAFPTLTSGQDEKLNSMLMDIVFWALNYEDKPGNLFLLSENKNFGLNSKKQDKFSPIRQSMQKKGFNVIMLSLDTLMGMDVTPFCIQPEDQS